MKKTFGLGILLVLVVVFLATGVGAVGAVAKLYGMQVAIAVAVLISAMGVCLGGLVGAVLITFGARGRLEIEPEDGGAASRRSTPTRDRGARDARPQPKVLPPGSPSPDDAPNLGPSPLPAPPPLPLLATWGPVAEGIAQAPLPSLPHVPELPALPPDDAWISRPTSATGGTLAGLASVSALLATEPIPATSPDLSPMPASPVPAEASSTAPSPESPASSGVAPAAPIAGGSVSEVIAAPVSGGSVSEVIAALLQGKGAEAARAFARQKLEEAAQARNLTGLYEQLPALVSAFRDRGGRLGVSELADYMEALVVASNEPDTTDLLGLLDQVRQVAGQSKTDTPGQELTQVMLTLARDHDPQTVRRLREQLSRSARALTGKPSKRGRSRQSP